MLQMMLLHQGVLFQQLSIASYAILFQGTVTYIGPPNGLSENLPSGSLTVEDTQEKTQLGTTQGTLLVCKASRLILLTLEQVLHWHPVGHAISHDRQTTV